MFIVTEYAALNLWLIRRSLHIDKNQKIKFHSF